MKVVLPSFKSKRLTQPLLKNHELLSNQGWSPAAKTQRTRVSGGMSQLYTQFHANDLRLLLLDTEGRQPIVFAHTQESIYVAFISSDYTVTV